MKNLFSVKSTEKLKLTVCLLLLSSGLYMSFSNDSLISNAILGIGILVTNYNFSKLLNQ